MSTKIIKRMRKTIIAKKKGVAKARAAGKKRK